MEMAREVLREHCPGGLCQVSDSDAWLSAVAEGSTTLGCVTPVSWRALCLGGNASKLGFSAKTKGFPDKPLTVQ